MMKTNSFYLWVLTSALIVSLPYTSIDITISSAREFKTIQSNQVYQNQYDIPMAGIAIPLSKLQTNSTLHSMAKTVVTQNSKKSSPKRENPIRSNIPNDEPDCISSKKTFMSYTAITSKTSEQYKLQQRAYTDKETGIRMVDKYYLVAVGTYYAEEVGQKLLVTMKSGTVIPCMVGDFKSDDHTDPTHRYHVGGMENGVYYEGDGSVLEFVVDMDVFEGSSTYPDWFDGDIIRIDKE